jgi:hypothetical protein
VILYYILILYPDDGQSPEDNWYSRSDEFEKRARKEA